jgi:uncharacterized protein
VPDSGAVVTSTPRLLEGAHGWWYLGGRKLLLLGRGSVDAAGELLPVVAQELSTAQAHGPTPVRAYSLTVLTATACNLGCGYCFQNTAPDPRGGSQPPRIGVSWLRGETIGQILEFTAAKMAAAGLPALNVHLFGGEPLLNVGGCVDLLDRAQDHGLASARMTSNATLLTAEVARRLSRAGLGSVQVTFDGSRADHDSIRVRRSGGGTFDAILANLAAASEVSTLAWDLRVNVSHRNLAGMADLAEQVAQRVDPSRCQLGFSLVDDVGVGHDNTLTRDAELAEVFAGWVTRAIELGFRISRPRPAVPCQECSLPDGQFGAVVNADGTLYSCWESAGKDGWDVGTVRDGYLPRQQVAGRWVSCGYERRGTDLAAVRRFRDLVDARVLDYLHSTGQLWGRPTAGQPPGQR